ncbi:MAG: UDP-N-acetylmuramate dehydrogenase, partial [Bacillota bacterium]
ARALGAGLTGLEFASGIPGSLGGALFMNAGAYGQEMKDIVEEALLFDYSGIKQTVTNQELNFSYRHSLLKEKPLIAVRAKMSLKPASSKKIKKLMKKLNQKRKDKQPLEWPSAGSIFKRPPDNYAGSLIEKTGLKGLKIGGAEVSRKHAGFIINKGKATASDIKRLVSKVQQEVYENTGIKLEPEPVFIGEFSEN